MATNDDTTPDMELLTITRLWNFPKHLHNLGGVPLTVTGPISHRAIVYFLAVFGPILVLARLLHLSLIGPATFVQITVPALIVWWALRVASAGGAPRDVVSSWGRYSLHVARDVLAGGPRPVRVRSRVQVREGGFGARSVPVRLASAGAVWAVRVRLAVVVVVVRVLAAVNPVRHSAGMPVELAGLAHVAPAGARPVLARVGAVRAPRPVVREQLPVEEPVCERQVPSWAVPA